MKIADAGSAHSDHPFYGMKEHIERALKSGAVVICLDYATYVSHQSSFEGNRKDLQATTNLKSTFTYASKSQGPQETTYDWLDQGFLGATRLDTLDARPVEQIAVTSAAGEVRSYFGLVKRACKTIYGVQLDRTGRKGTLEYQRQQDPSSAACSPVTARVNVLAVNEVTGEPVAAEIKHPDASGSLVFLPRFEEPSGESARVIGPTIAMVLKCVAEWFYQRNIQEAGVKEELPEWVKGHRSEKAKDLDSRLQKLDAERSEVSTERDKHDEMLELLCGTGEPLRLSVEKFFGSPWLGFDVEVSAKGASIDQLVHDRATARSLAVEVTGVSGKFHKNDPHLADVLDYLPTHTEKNLAERTERIVLAVNTYRDTPVADRNDKDDFTEPVKKMAGDIRFCLIRTSDLYALWLDHIAGRRTAAGIFDSIFSCVGLYTYRKPRGSR